MVVLGEKMKKTIILLIAISLTILTGCKYIQSDNLKETDAGITVGCLEYKVNEWISPDGVHYWMYLGNGIGIAPRYDSEGNLVIDKER